jgi:hypothetical protein
MAFPDPVVAGETLVVPGIHSIDYVDGGTTGWRIGRDGSASFNNVDLIGNVGAGSGSIANLTVAETLSLSNYDDVGSTLDTLTGAAADTKGQIVGWWDQTDAPLSGISTEIKTIGLDVLLQPDRIYRVDVYCRLTMSATTASGQMLLRAQAQTDGSFNTTAPTIANTPGIVMQVTFNGAGTSLAVTPYGIAIINTTGWGHDTWVRMILTIGCSAGTAGQASGSSTWGSPTSIITTRYAPPSRIVVLDSGPSNSLNFHAKGYNTTDTPPVTGGSTAPVPKTYTKTYYGTWSRTYDGNNATTWDDSAYCYQGYYSSTRGNTRSLIGFNYTQIQNDLSGATINSCYFGIRGAHAYYNSGFTCYLGTHTYTAKPSTWNSANVTEATGFVTGLAAGESLKINMGTGLGNSFKSGAVKGMAIGPGPTTSLIYYGFIYGATQTGKPYLTITYTK